jgi:DNA-binding SARP family transcriptional activator
MDAAMAIRAASLQPHNGAVGSPHTAISICLLGGFLLLRRGQPVALRHRGKAEALLSLLAIQHGYRAARDTLLHALWPTADPNLNGQSLHSLVHSLHKLIGDALGGARPILYDEGYYRLNIEAGIAVDVAIFDALADAGDQQYQLGNVTIAVANYGRAVELYRGDLWVHAGDANADMQALLEGERLRARYLTLLARLSDYHYAARDYASCLSYAWSLLSRDPWREDAHRLVMHCHVRQGERAEALRHYQLCERILRTELGAAPETATRELFERIRSNSTGL